MNARTQAQKDANWLRAFGSVERAGWVNARPSVATGRGPCVNAHVKSGGTSRKADYIWIVPLTWHEHANELHQHGQKTFERLYGIDLIEEAVKTELAWQAFLRGETRPSW